MAVLRVQQGRSTAREFEVGDMLVIGRSVDSGVRVFDEAASRQHARIVREGEGYLVEDLGSTNGTYVNGRKVERCLLRSGDEIAVRDLTLLFLDDAGADRPTVIESRGLSIASRLEPRRSRVSGNEEELLGRLAAVYRFTSVLSGPVRRIRKGVVDALGETFGPCRAALVLPDGDIGIFDRELVDHVRRRNEAVVSNDRAMAAPLGGGYGALFVEGREFTDRDLELLVALANAATPVLQPARARAAPAKAAQETLGRSPAVKRLRKEIERIAPSDVTVLVTGETGTGKELVARALHAFSPRQAGPFVAVNCAAFVETLLEAELFGHEKGAFTGADRARPGHFEQAHTGTLFLDEVGELAPGLQAKLLRVLETREFRRVGATKTTRVDVRVISATNRDLKSGDRFREDLYYRLGVITIDCPPLRERTGDIKLLAEAFAKPKRFTDNAMKALEAYPWPGNIRELKNVCDRCTVLTDKQMIETETLPLEIRLGGQPALESGEVKTLKQMEREMVLRALKATGGNRTKAAKLLGITYPTLKKKIDEMP